MNDSSAPLETPEAFAAFKERIRQQLAALVQDRIDFLDGARGELAALEALTRQSGNAALIEEVSRVVQQAEIQLRALKNGSSNGAASAASASAQPVLFAATGRIEIPAQPQPSVPRQAPRPAPVVPPVPKMPSRAPEEIYRDVERLSMEAEQAETDTGKPGLIRLKGLLCRQRALQAELAAQDIQHWPLRQLHGYLRRRIDDEHGAGHYLISLRQDVWPSEPWPWMQLAELYDELAEAYEALDWFDDNSESLTGFQRHELLESLAARQTRMYRLLHTYFPRQTDEHQVSLFRELCAIADDEDVYLYCLQERAPDVDLEERAHLLPDILDDCRRDSSRRTKRDETLQSLRALVNRPDFGSHEDDARRLEKAILECRAEGIPASNVTLRELAGGWTDLLETSSERAVQEVLKEVLREAERQAARDAKEEEGEDESPLSESERSELAAVREIVRGKRCLFIGGVCKEETRQRIERELELSELVWPSTSGTESIYRFEPDIQSTDITVVLVRFMRTGWGQARELAVRHNKEFVRLPAGYSPRQVVRQFHNQLVSREAVVASR